MKPTPACRTTARISRAFCGQPRVLTEAGSLIREERHHQRRVGVVDLYPAPRWAAAGPALLDADQLPDLVTPLVDGHHVHVRHLGRLPGVVLVRGLVRAQGGRTR